MFALQERYKEDAAAAFSREGGGRRGDGARPSALIELVLGALDSALAPPRECSPAT